MSLPEKDLRKLAAAMSRLQRHRGPDWSGVYSQTLTVGDASTTTALAHERLAIVDPISGEQPLFARDDDSLILVVNGEIYNHKALRADFADEHTFRTEVRTDTLMLS